MDRLRSLICALGRQRSLRDPIALAVEELGLTPAQVHTLLWLGEDGPLTMGELSRRVGITGKTMTGIVDRLVRQGYLARERFAADRRVIQVRLARKGAGTFRRLDRQMRRKLDGLLARLSGRDRRDLFRILENLRAQLAFGSDAAPAGAVRKA